MAGQSATDSLIHSFNTNKNDSLRIDASIRLYDLMIGTLPDSLYQILEEAIYLAEKKNLDDRVAKLEMLKGQILDRLNNYVSAQQAFLRAEVILEGIKGKIPDSTYLKLKIAFFNNMATVFFRTGKLEEALGYYEQIIHYLQHASEAALPLKSKVYYMIAYNNIGSVYLQQKKYDPAETYYLKSITYLEEDNKVALSSILNNLGIIEKDRGNFQKSLDYLNRSLQLRREKGFIAGEVQALNNIGDLFWKMGETRKALDTLLKVSEMAKEHKLIQSYNIAAEKLASIYYELGDYRKAYLTHLDFKLHYDSLMNQENLSNITQIEMQHRFEQKMHEENMQRQKEDLIRQRRETTYFFTAITAILLLSLITLLYALQQSKLKRHQLAAEKDRLRQKSLELENEKLNIDLEYKNKELTTNVIYLARTNEFISGIAEKLMKHRIYFTKENQKLVDGLIRELTSFSDRDTWKEFELRFQEVHKDFYNKLNEQFPDLSSNEKKLCAFLRLNMTTKEISAITYQSINSITVARSRLRKKLGIDQDENLIAFLEKL
jgi:tetratricopeptide (TPR) repeat protein